MKRRSFTPSARLLRAVVAERDDLERRRDGLLEQRRALQAQLDDIEATVAELDQRLVLIGRLAGDASPRADARVEAAAAQSDGPSEDMPLLLRGPAIRAAAVRVLLAHPQRPEAIHYREWFALLREAGYAVAGKDPLAVFLTQLSRSPIVRRGTQSGVYELDLHAPVRLRHQLDDLQAQLHALTATGSSSATDLGSIRGRRTALNLEISKIEKALEEADETLRQPRETVGLAAVR